MNKNKLNLRQKIKLYKMRKLTWKDKEAINKPLTKEEVLELQNLELM